MLLGIFTYAVSYIARLPESNCRTQAISAHWSPDRAYKATLMEKNCNLGETIFYSVRIDANSPPLKSGWFVPGYELEDDEYPTVRPTLSWAAERRLEIRAKTRTIHGTIILNTGDDLTVVRTYIAREPEAFPNY